MRSLFIALLLIAPRLFGQAPSLVTWSSVSPPDSQAYRNWNRGVFDSSHNLIILYQGETTSGADIYSRTVWALNSGTGTFTKLYTARSTTGDDCNGGANYTGPAAPMARHPYNALDWDSTAHAMWIMSGVCGGTRLQDTWQFSSSGTAASGTWASVALTNFPPTGNTSGLDSHSIAYDPTDDDIFLVGGETGSGAVPLNLTAVYCKHADPQPSGRSIGCGSTVNDWVTLTTTGLIPLVGHVAFWSTTLNALVAYGGSTSSGVKNSDIYTYAPTTQTWTKQTVTGTVPPTTNSYAYAGEDTLRGVLVAVTGSANGYALNLRTWAWSQLTYSGTTANVSVDPSTQVGQFVYDPVNDKYVVIGGGQITPVFSIGTPSPGAVTGQFRILGTWPSGNAKWIEVDGLVPSLAAGGTASLTLTGPGGLSIPFTVQEALYPGGSPGVARTNEPFTVGLPIADSAAITSTSGLALIGSTTVTGTLATDNGATITVNTGTATFTLKKANHNGIDIAVVGSTTVLATGASGGWVINGPSPTATFPGNVTCSPTSGGTSCTTVYSSANDSASACSIDTINSVADNGPVRATIKCTWTYTDGASHTYMHGTARYTFYTGKTYVKILRELRNADHGTSSTFATAYKGIASEELRVTPNISGTLSYQVAVDSSSCTSGVCSGTMTTSDTLTLYQAQTTAMQWPDCASSCLSSYTTDVGYSAKKNTTTLASDTGGTLTVGGWALLANASGVGVEIGVNQLSPYWPKSLEFNNGTDVRIGLWPRESSAPYYIPYPQYDIQTAWLNFFTTTPSSPGNEFLKFQQYLVAYASVSTYQNSGVFPYPLTTASQDDTYYTGLSSGGSGPATPANPSLPVGDFCCLADATPYVYRFYSWPQGGGGNQAEFRWSDLLNLIKRGYTGRYLNSAQFYAMEMSKTFPRADFSGGWRQYEGTGQLDGFGFPTNITSQNGTLSFSNYVEWEHEHWYGLTDYYFMTGDETVHDALLDGPTNYFLDSTSAINAGGDYNIRAVGGHLMGASRLALMLNATGDTTDGGNVLAQGVTTFGYQVKPHLCVSGFPPSCSANTYTGTVNTSGSTVSLATGASFNDTMLFGPFQIGSSFYPVSAVNSTSSITLLTSAGSQAGASYQYTSQGQSTTRGLPYIAGTDNQCTPGGAQQRSVHTFMLGIWIGGIWELRQAKGSSWADYWTALDLAYGGALWALSEGYGTDGLTAWTNNGFRYNVQIDIANNCGAGEYTPQANQTVWPIYFLKFQEEGNTVSAWQQRFNQAMMQDGSALGGNVSDWGQYQVSSVIYDVLNPGTVSLQPQTITSFVDNGGGSYTIGWNTPSGTTNLRVKWAALPIVDWIGYDATNGAFSGSPSTTANWFAATNAASIPAPVAGAQSMTISTGVTGLTSSNFSVKAMAPAPSGGGSFLSGGVSIKGNTVIKP